MDALATFRAMIPGLSAVGDPMVNVWLTLAAKRHDPASFGSVFVEAMCFWAAHFILKITGPSGTGSGDGGGMAVGALVGQKDGDLSRSYAAPPSSGTMDASDQALATTEYGRAYLELRDSRAETSPMTVPSCP